jgi:hypothetical protein
MADKPASSPVERRNGHATIGQAAAGETEPKGYPTSDRYQAETAHAAETDDHTKIDKPHRGK